MNLTNFILSFFLLISFNLNAQRVEDTILEIYNDSKSDNPKEFAYLRTDRKIYFSGESVGFQLALLDQYLQPSQLSKVMYIELLHEKGNYRKKFAFRIENGLVGDDIEIPLNIPTGNYQLVAYTHFMNNFQFDLVADRALVYIQNTSEAPARVAKTITLESDDRLSMGQASSSFSIRKNETSTKVLFEINTANRVNKNCYLISEGLRGIQFIAKVRLNKKRNNLAINKERLKGNFQKVILVDDSLNLLAGLSYYLKKALPPLEYEISSKALQMDNGMLGKVEMTSEPLHLDSIHLFKRIYQLFYDLPAGERIDDLNFEQLISSSTLSKFSKYTLREWARILSRSEGDVDYLPEQNLHIRGQLIGDLSKLKGATYSVHFFENKMDFLHLLDQSGRVDLEIPWPIKSDRYHAAITDHREKNISGFYEISLNSEPQVDYLMNQYYYPRSLTDSLIGDRMQLGYILSTYKKSNNHRRFFWQGYTIDRTVNVNDYRGLANFEEFVREAVMDLSVVKTGGKKQLNIYNSFEGNFSSPYMVVLNNQILIDSHQLFNIPLSDIKSVKMIYLKESLKRLGKTITNGVVIVETKKDEAIPERFLESKAGYIVGFDKMDNLNPIAKSFSPSMLLKLQFADRFNLQLNSSKETGDFIFTTEIISSDGNYNSLNKRLEIK